MLAGVALGEPDPEALRLFAVHIDRTPRQSWPGYGIYLGDGLVITASHVVHEAAVTRPKVVVDGVALPAHAVKEGSLQTVDLTLLSIEPQQLPARLVGRRLELCKSTPPAGTDVIVAIPERTTRTRIVSSEPFSFWIRVRFGTLVADVPGTGNSGSGVFDAQSGCLRGIISRKVARNSAGELGEYSDKYFVPADVIRRFIPEDFDF